MQPGDRQLRQLRGNAGAPGVGAVGGKEGDAAPGFRPSRMKTFWMRPIRSVAP